MELGTDRLRTTRPQTTRPVALLAALALCAAGCATAVRPAPEWIKTRDSAEDLDRAREACKELALKEVAGATSSSLAAPVGAGSFFKCMASKGWVQAAKATPPPGQ